MPEGCRCQVGVRISLLLPEPWSWGCQLPSWKHMGLWSWSFVGGARKGLCGVHVSLWKRHCVVCPRGQSRNRSLDKTQFILLSSVFLQYCSPSTVPRLFPAEVCPESLLVNGVLLLVHGNWNKMQLSSSFTETHNPQRLQAYHSML